MTDSNLYSLVQRGVGLLTHGSLPKKRCSRNKAARTLSKVGGRGWASRKWSTTRPGSNSCSASQDSDRNEKKNVQRVLAWCAGHVTGSLNESIKRPERPSFSTYKCWLQSCFNIWETTNSCLHYLWLWGILFAGTDCFFVHSWKTKTVILCSPVLTARWLTVHVLLITSYPAVPYHLLYFVWDEESITDFLANYLSLF